MSAVDPDALAAALDPDLIGFTPDGKATALPKRYFDVVHAAARAVLEAPTAQYCKRHGSWGPDGACEAKVRFNFDSTCEMVGRVRLVAERSQE